MAKEKLLKEIRLKDVENLQVRNDEQEQMIIEGYPIVFNQETFIECWNGGFFEKIDPNAFANADMSDVCLKYNHNDDFFILARTRNGSLTLTIDEHGVFMHAELINTTQNRDVYEMVKSELLKEGSFAFTVEKFEEEVRGEEVHVTIKSIGKLFDVAICPNGAYGDLTEIYARSYEKLESFKRNKAEAEKKLRILKLRNINKLKLMEAKNNGS